MRCRCSHWLCYTSIVIEQWKTPDIKMWGQKYFGVLNELSKSSSISYDLFYQNLNSCLFTLIQTHFRKIPKIIHLGENLAKYIHGLEVQNISNITAIYIWELCAGVKALYYDKQKYIFLINGIFVKKNITLQYRSSVVWNFSPSVKMSSVNMHHISLTVDNPNL